MNVIEKILAEATSRPDAAAVIQMNRDGRGGYVEQMIRNVNDSSKKRTGKMKQLRTIVAVLVFAIFSCHVQHLTYSFTC